MKKQFIRITTEIDLLKIPRRKALKRFYKDPKKREQYQEKKLSKYKW